MVKIKLEDIIGAFRFFLVFSKIDFEIVLVYFFSGLIFLSNLLTFTFNFFRETVNFEINIF